MDVRVGTLSRFSARELADRAAERVMERQAPLALCLSPEGRVTLESYADAVFEDVVGVYSRDAGLIGLYRSIRDDLAHEIEARGITGRIERRYVRRAA
ncbi:MAG: hypothetical protein GX856_02915 [Gammaproteobacteria bacterium]|jgi:hypothetical protein|nr:hypothetical protein [Gammaproteobacteria bacterium]